MRRIQKTIQVTKPTATIDSVPPSASCAVNDSDAEEKVRTAPNARLSADGGADAGPDQRQAVAPPGAHEVRDEDADDQRGLQPLAQPDEEVRQHVVSSVSEVR